MPMYPLSTLHDDPENVRRVPLTREEIDAVANSMHQIGQLQPIVVRRMDDGTELPAQYYVTIGRTRVAAARLLNWPEIEGRELNAELAPNEYSAMSAAENMVRAPMHPVDEWRALKALIDRGMQMTTAADILGITHHYARRLDKLGRMAPVIINALTEQPDLPRNGDLAIIASAPVTVQETAYWATAKRRKGDNPIDWSDLTLQCQRTRIPRNVAIFDVTAKDVIFEEDLFAEPGSSEQFTTTDVKGFLAAQAIALQERIDKSKGRMVMSSVAQYSQYPEAPPGYSASWEKVPKRWKKDDPRKLAVAIIPMGHSIGQVCERVIVPKAPRKAPDGQGEIIEDKSIRPRAAVNIPTLATFASMKDAAIVTAMRRCAEDWASDNDWTKLVRVLLLLFASNNVTVQTTQQMYGRGSISRTVTGLALGDVTPRALWDTAIAVIDHVIRCDHPKIGNAGSGDIANVIAKLVGAEDHLERCDNADILKGISGDALKALAREFGINDHGKVSDVRKRMVGNMPGYKGPGFVSEPIAGELMDDDDEQETEGEEAEA